MLEREKIPKRTEASSKVAQYRGNTGFIWGSKLAQNIVNKLSRKFSLSCDRFFFIVFFFLQTKEKSAKVIQLGRNWSSSMNYTHFFHKTLMRNMTDCSTDRHNCKKKAGSWESQAYMCSICLAKLQFKSRSQWHFHRVHSPLRCDCDCDAAEHDHEHDHDAQTIVITLVKIESLV